MFDDHMLPRMVYWKICAVTLLTFVGNVIGEQMGELQYKILFLFVFCSLISRSCLLDDWIINYGLIFSKKWQLMVLLPGSYVCLRSVNGLPQRVCWTIFTLVTFAANIKNYGTNNF